MALNVKDSPTQLSFPLTAEIDNFSDLRVTDVNRAALQVVQNWPAWNSHALHLTGPEKSGLTTLTRLWSAQAEARLIDAARFNQYTQKEIEALATHHCALDDADQITHETNLLMLYNLTAERGRSLLLTAHSPAMHAAYRSADLKSRLASLTIAEIYPPDEAMLAARLVAACRRHYLKLNQATLDYLIIRLPRVYTEIETYVLRLDEEIHRTGRSPSVPLAKTVLEMAPNP